MLHHPESAARFAFAIGLGAFCCATTMTVAPASAQNLRHVAEVAQITNQQPAVFGPVSATCDAGAGGAGSSILVTAEPAQSWKAIQPPAINSSGRITEALLFCFPFLTVLTTRQVIPPGLAFPSSPPVT
jgi:hypothetical protein